MLWCVYMCNELWAKCWIVLKLSTLNDRVGGSISCSFTVEVGGYWTMLLHTLCRMADWNRAWMLKWVQRPVRPKTIVVANDCGSSVQLLIYAWMLKWMQRPVKTWRLVYSSHDYGSKEFSNQFSYVCMYSVQLLIYAWMLKWCKDLSKLV